MIERLAKALLAVSGGIFLVLSMLTLIGVILIWLNGGQVRWEWSHIMPDVCWPSQASDY